MLHFVDQQNGTHLIGPGDFPDFAEERGEVLFGIARIGHANGATPIEPRLQTPGPSSAEGLDHRQRALDALLGPVSATHVDQQPRRHAGEGFPEIGVGPDLLHVGRGPAGLRGQDVELHQKHGLPDAPQTGIDEAAVVRAGPEALDQGHEGLEVVISPGEGPRLAAGSGRVGVVRACSLSPTLWHLSNPALRRP